MSTTTPPPRPAAALAMIPGVEGILLSPDARAELESLVDLVTPEAADLASLDDATLATVEIVVGGWGCTVLDHTLLARMPRLRLLAYAAGTVKHTVTPACWERDLAVSSAAAANAVPVAEFTFAAIVMIAKDVFRVRDRHREVRGREPVVGQGPAGPVGARGLRIGVVGASHIGRLLIARLHTLDVEIAVADPYLSADDAAALAVEAMALDDLVAWADVITIHAPELPSTRHMFDADRLARMRDGAWLVNTARGSLVDTEALTRECVAGRLCACIDTPDPEPLPAESPLYDLPNVVLTPHIAGSLGNEVSRMGDLAVAEVRRFLAGEPLLHPVRATDLERIA
ncbi:MAG: 2-hydroxyacid dehydrogenase [Acidimicrobiia bacterium]